jgi:hypothetical protein
VKLEGLYVWQIHLKTIHEIDGSRVFSMFVVSPDTTKKAALQFAKMRIHTPQWWDDYLITDITKVGEVWALRSKQEGR